jgi:hypothetical protein
MLVAPMWLGRGGQLRRAFECKPLAWLGLVSYGVYLWHWPILMWLGVPSAKGVDRLLRGSLVLILTIGVAALSYYWIERPIRLGRQHGRHTQRSEAWQRRVVLIAVPLVMLATACTSIAATTVPPPTPGVPVVMIVGDSVPLRLEAALERAGVTRGWRVVSAAKGDCPVSGEPHVYDWNPPHQSLMCLQVPAAQDALIRTTDPRVVVWWDRLSLSNFITPGGKHVTSGSARFWKLRMATLATTVNRLTAGGAMVVFVATEPPGEAMATRCGKGCDHWVKFQINHYTDITSRWNGIMRAYAAAHPDRAAFVSLTPAICRTDIPLCDDRIDGVPARPDGTHYESTGEQKVVITLLDLLAPIVMRTGRLSGPTG